MSDDRRTTTPVRPTGTQIIAPGHTFATVSDKISSIVLTRRTPLYWFIPFLIASGLVMVFLVAVAALLVRGVGLWGIKVPVMWGWAITNFVWWIGIGHAGTLISAILLLLRQSWRNSINRFAEAMTLFAVACAGMFPLLHLGRPWLFYWLFPYPNTMGVQPQFRSPLVWDVFAVSTYATVSALFWYVGLIPDLATLRDRTRYRAARIVYGILAMGWRGAASHWQKYETASLLLAGLATPLVLSVHTVVSFDFTVAIVPGWHSTIFPPYFVAGAIYSGFAMVLMLAIPIRKFYGLEDFITERHLDNSAKVMLATGLIVAYGYGIEAFMGWYSGNRYDSYLLWNRLHGPYHVVYFALLACNIFIPQVLWIRKLRVNPLALFLVSGVILVGMWLERFIIVVVSLQRDFLTSSWGMYYPTRWDWATYIGT
ncbi:MAG TPA: NrfD/PsrC family molybdoenzyme membrane anchor subunit, partial [Bryobacteraceae bacterium]|nr:NrfD/PsrC family molybdoenzyme membrane anchor subunit [Bryobacteraceae bacterium]